MKSQLPLALILFSLVVFGCVSTSRVANEVADKAMYQPIAYTNAATQGPQVVVLPSEIKSNNTSFARHVASSNICDFAEIELTKANFGVIDNSASQQYFQEVALAASLGDASALRVLKKGKLAKARWFVSLNIIKAEPTSNYSKDFNGASLGTLVELAFLLGSKGHDNSLGKAAGKFFSSIKYEEISMIWEVAATYDIIDAVTGQKIASGQVTEPMESKSVMQSFVGVTNTNATNVLFDAVVQRIVQKAVQEIDSKYKNIWDGKLVASVQSKSSRDEGAISAEYKKKVEAINLQKDKDAAVAALRNRELAYAEFDAEGVLFYSHEKLAPKFIENSPNWLSLPSKIPDWRKYLKYDKSGETYELVEYTPNRAKVKLGGSWKIFMYNADTHKIDKMYKENKAYPDEIYDMIKVDGQWKVATAYIDDKKLTVD